MHGKATLRAAVQSPAVVLQPSVSAYAVIPAAKCDTHAATAGVIIFATTGSVLTAAVGNDTAAATLNYLTQHYCQWCIQVTASLLPASSTPIE